MNLRGKLLLAVGIPLLVGGIASALASVRVGGGALRAAADAELAEAATRLASGIGDWLEERRADMAYWSRTTTFQTAFSDNEYVAKKGREGANGVLGEITTAFPLLEVMHLVGPDGVVLASSSADQIGKLNLGERDYVKQALAGQTGFGAPTISKRSGKPVLPVSAPIRKGDVVLGVLVGITSLDAFSRATVGSFHRGERGYAYLLDAKGLVLCHPKPEHILTLDLGQQPFGRAILASEAGHSEYAFEDIEKFAAHRRIPGPGWTVVATADTTEFLAPIRKVELAILGVSGTVFLVILAVVWIAVGRTVVRPTRRTQAALEAAAAGDLAQRVGSTSDDELGCMARALDHTLDGIKAALAADRIDWETVARQTEARRTTVAQLASAAAELTSISQHMAAAAEETGSQTQSVGAAAEEVSSNANSVATGAEELSASIKEIARNASEAARVGKEAVADADQANGTIDRLGSSAREIDAVVKSIAKIAQQTNLLALNASIEAANAGSAGRGFAVVANEVKELARQTSEATEDIRRRVSAIQADSGQAVAAVKAIAEVIRRINDLQQSIASAVEEQAATTQEISRTIGEAAKGAGDIAGSVATVALAMGEQTRQAASTKEAAGRLSALAAGLKD